MPNAVITGATQGIGKAIAEKLLSEGVSIAICARTQKDLDALQKEWENYYPDENIYTCKADLSKKKDVHAFAKYVLKHMGSIDIIVNNAGLFIPSTLQAEPDGRLEELMNINLYSAYYLTKDLLPTMKEKQNGHIFNICSVASHKAYPNGGSYGITKYALLGFSDNLREELKDEGIRITAISPGATYSRSWAGTGVDPDRIMDPNDVSDMLWAAYTLSSKANVESILLRPTLGDL